MMCKCYSISRSPIDESNDIVSKSWIVWRHRIVVKLTAAEDLVFNFTLYNNCLTNILHAQEDPRNPNKQCLHCQQLYYSQP